MLSKAGQFQYSDDSSDNETQILFVGDPTQIAALQVQKKQVTLIKRLKLKVKAFLLNLNIL